MSDAESSAASAASAASSSEGDGDDASYASEYSYYPSEEEEEEEGGGGEDVPPAAVARAAGTSRPAHNPLAELDRILAECDAACAAAVRPEDAARAQRGARSDGAAAPPPTSTLRAGVGYEVGRASDARVRIATHMGAAAEKQRERDARCRPLLARLAEFLAGYEGDEGVVLLALKMSIGFNRLLFSLLKNDSLRDWEEREIYTAALDLIGVLSSQFYAGILLHNLLEGNGSPDDGASNCQCLLETVYVKAGFMTRALDVDDASVAKDASAQKIIATYEKVTEAIRSGRDRGIISDPDRELTSKDVAGADGGARRPLTSREEAAAYVTGMQRHRLRHVPLLQAARQGARHAYLGDAARAGAAGTVRPRRMRRIASELAGLSTDLPCAWASGIFVVVDEDRPDVLKACIMGPEDTPYATGCFEFDVFLPPSYPDVPPKVHLCTTSHNSVRFNPNLYHDGKVCLSLLGTWQGPGWIPDTSTLLQVLLSIQSLILVPDPFFNEPGHSASDPAQQRRSKDYDRQIRAATLKVALLFQMKKPSPLFADCIRDHFRLKRRHILTQMEEWEELERRAGAGAASGAAGAEGLVAQGGIRSSAKIVTGFCDKIREHIAETWPEEDGEGAGSNGE